MKRSFLLLWTLLLIGFVHGQGLPIRITITVAPPYPTSLSYYGDHPEQVLINVTNLTRVEQSFRLVGNIVGIDNNVKILTKDRGASELITLNPSESRLLSSPEIQDLFDASKFTYTGINYSRAQIDDGLPEGTYEVCGYAVDPYQTNVLKSENTCSNPILVSNLEPPIIISPLPDAQVQEMPVQNMVFTWTLPASAPPNTEYTLRIVEIMGSLNPNNAIQAATTPIFFEKSTTVNTMLYGPADPPFTVGKKYAFMVTAKDPAGKAVFRNGGKSAVQTFVYGEPATPAEVPSSVQLNSPANKAKMLPTIQNGSGAGYEFTWSGPDKTLYNQRYSIRIARLKENQSPAEGLANDTVFYTRTMAAKPGKFIFRPNDVYGFPTGKYAWQVTLITQSVSSSNQGAKPVLSNIYTFEGTSRQTKIAGNIRYRMGSTPKEPTYGFANKPIKLVVSYAAKASDVAAGGITPEAAWVVDGMCDLSGFVMLSGYNTKLYPDAGKVVGEATTNHVGGFTTFVYEDLEAEVELTGDNGPPLKMYKIIKVVPADPDNRYTMADGFFVAKSNPLPDKPKNMEVAQRNFVVRALTFQLNVKLATLPKKNYLGQGLTPESSVDTKTDVYVLRKKKILNDNFPEHEGDTAFTNQTININGQGYHIVSRKSSYLGQTVSFSNLVRTKAGIQEDKLYIYAKLKNNKGEIVDPQEFKSYFKWKSYNFYNLETGDVSDDGNEVDQKFFTNDYDKHDYLNNDNTNELTLKPNKLTNTVISGVLKTHWACDVQGNQKSDRPLANTSVTLRSHFVFQPQGKNYTVEVAHYNMGSNYTFGTTTTDANGNFSFNVNIGFTGTDYETNNSNAIYSDAYQDNGLGWVQKNYKFTGPTGYGYLSNATGTLFKVLKLEVNNPYVTSPDEAIMVTPGFTYYIGTLLSNIREGDLTVTVKTFDESNSDVYNKPLRAAKVYLCRMADSKNTQLPSDEGNINKVVKSTIKHNGLAYKVIAEEKTDVNGNVYFSRMVKSMQVADYYTLIVKEDETGDQNYSGTKLYWAKKYCDNLSIGDLDATKSVFNSEEPCYAGKGCFKATMEADPLPPVIAGAVYPNSKTSFNPIAGATVELFTISEAGFKYIKDSISSKSKSLDETADAFAMEGQFALKFLGFIQWEKDMKVTDNGKFRFDNLQPGADGKQPRRLVWVKKSGFLDQVLLVNSGTPLTLGQKANLGSVFLRLPVTVTAELVEFGDDKKAVKAKAIVGDNYSWEGSHAGSKCETINISPVPGYNVSVLSCNEVIDLKCPRGKVQVTFYPEDADHYLPLTTTINVPSGVENYTLPSKIRFSTKKHRIDLLVKEKGTKTFPKIVKVELLNASITKFKSNASLNLPNGGVYGNPGGPYYVAPIMEFESAVDDFTFKVSADGYVTKEIKIHNEPSDIGINYDVELEPAGMVKGIVKGPNSQPVANAKVFFETGGGTVETTTAYDGKYELDGVPLNKNITLKAVANNYIGDEKTFDSSPKATSSTGTKVFLNGKWVTVNTTDITTAGTTSKIFHVDLTLSKVEDLDLTAIAGFKVEITKAVKSGTGYSVTGRLAELPENGVFSSTSTNSVSFHDVEVQSAKEKYGSSTTNNGKPTACLKNGALIDALGLPVKLYKKVQGTVVGGSFAGIDWVEEGENKGVIKASILGDLSSFPSGIEKSGVSGFGLIPKTATNPQSVQPTFTADKSFASTGFKVKHSYKNESFKFRLHEYYEAEADLASTFQDGILKLNTTIHTKLEHFADGGDINLEVGTVTVTPEDGVLDINGSSTIKLNLGKAKAGKSNWSIQSNNWNFGKGGLVLKKGTLNTGIGVTFKDMLVTDTKLLFGDYNTTGGLTLGNDIPLAMEPTATLAFGYDAGFGDGAWALSILPGPDKAYCATFNSLPGISGSFQVSNVKTFSTGDMQIGLNTFAPVQVYNKTAVFRPATINVSDGYVNIWGDLDYEIPNMPMKESYALTFVKKNGQLTMEPMKKAFKIEINGVVVNFPASGLQTLNSEGLAMNGILEDKVPGIYKFNVVLRKKSTGEIDINTYGDNKFFTEKNSTAKGLEQVQGSMVVEGDKRWGYFAFNGKMFGYEGVKPEERTMYMVVKGDIEADPKTKIGVSNMNSSLGNMSIVYNIEKSALIGTLHTEQQVSGCAVTMDLELFFGKSNWYLFGAGDATLPSGFPITQLKVAFLVGKFMIPELSPTIPNTFSEFTWNKKLPLALSPSGEGNSDPGKGESTKNTYKAEYIGILFAGGFAMPIPKLPEINIDLKPIASASLTHEIHANLVMGLNFANPTIAIDANVGAKLNLSVGASMGVICAGLDLNVAADLYAAGLLKISPLYFSITGGAQVTLSGSMMVGGGLCDSDCDGYFCATDSFSKSKTLGVRISYVYGQGTGTPNFKFCNDGCN